MARSPTITFVVAGRNDDHGGNQVRRAQIFVSSLMTQIEKHNVMAEVVFVEWNPVANKKRLYECLNWPSSSCPVRVIEVPRRIHKRYAHSDELQFFQMIAKNVGIRRAKGRFVLVTNLDVVFSTELMGFLGETQFDPMCFYRLNRYDVRKGVPLEAPLDEQLAYCAHNILRVNTKSGTYAADWFYWHGLGFPKRVVTSVTLFFRRIVWRLEDIRSRTKAELSRLWRLIIRPRYPRLHTNGCGDFTLLARERWWALRGYPELPIFSFHLDSLFLHVAYQSGMREIVVGKQFRLYHVEHLSGWTPENESKMYRRLARVGIPVLTFPEYEAIVTAMNKKKQPLIFNNEDWGLKSEKLREIRVR